MIMYKPIFLNRLEQFSQIDYTMIAIDDEGILPDLRIDKTISLDDLTASGKTEEQYKLDLAQEDTSGSNT